MDKNEHILSGEEALNEYFTALLDEEWVEEEPVKAAEETVMQPAPPVVEQKQVAKEAVHEKPPANDKTIAHETATAQEPVLEAETGGESISVQASPTDYGREDPFHSVHREAEPQLAPEAKLHPDYHPSYTEVEYNEFEVPDLKDVQKLLDKLESQDVAAEADIETILAQNNAEIARTVSEVEEVQDWTIPETATVTEEPVEEVEVVTAEPESVVQEALSVTPAEPEQAELETPQAAVEPQAAQTQPGGLGGEEWTSTQRDESFQVLYFEVNGVTFAVPLDELGGIHRSGTMSHLIGRPGWYLGLQTSKEDQLDVVDTARWVMADRLVDESYKEDYKYVVMLGRSNWGLASTELKGTEILNAEKVRWREMAGKRPWLAGMVKEKMCALIHVEAMITMLNAGLDVKSLDS